MLCMERFQSISKRRPYTNTGKLDPEGARPDEHRSDGVTCL